MDNNGGAPGVALPSPHMKRVRKKKQQPVAFWAGSGYLSYVQQFCPKRLADCFLRHFHYIVMKNVEDQKRYVSTYIQDMRRDHFGRDSDGVFFYDKDPSVPSVSREDYDDFMFMTENVRNMMVTVSQPGGIYPDFSVPLDHVLSLNIDSCGFGSLGSVMTEVSEAYLFRLWHYAMSYVVAKGNQPTYRLVRYSDKYTSIYFSGDVVVGSVNFCLSQMSNIKKEISEMCVPNGAGLCNLIFKKYMLNVDNMGGYAIVDSPSDSVFEVRPFSFHLVDVPIVACVRTDGCEVRLAKLFDDYSMECVFKQPGYKCLDFSYDPHTNISYCICEDDLVKYHNEPGKLKHDRCSITTRTKMVQLVSLKDGCGFVDGGIVYVTISTFEQCIEKHVGHHFGPELFFYWIGKKFTIHYEKWIDDDGIEQDFGYEESVRFDNGVSYSLKDGVFVSNDKNKK